MSAETLFLGLYVRSAREAIAHPHLVRQTREQAAGIDRTARTHRESGRRSLGSHRTPETIDRLRGQTKEVIPNRNRNRRGLR